MELMIALVINSLMTLKFVWTQMFSPVLLKGILLLGTKWICHEEGNYQISGQASQTFLMFAFCVILIVFVWLRWLQRIQ